jgi:hypothetical protein
VAWVAGFDWYEAKREVVCRLAGVMFAPVFCEQILREYRLYDIDALTRKYLVDLE